VTDHEAAYRDAVGALTARGKFGIRLGLGRTRALLRGLGDPQAGLRGALIAGTNGKGSVQALVASMLGAAGCRVGQAPKPHLVEYRERIVVDGRPIAAGDFADLIGEMFEVAARVPRRLGPPTEFEVVTAGAFAWFARSGVEVAVVEVGLGGRLDATNAWDGGVAAVTNVAMDHAAILGGTLPRIAREKAAIIKRPDRAVTGASGEALAVVRRRARRLGVPLTEAAPLPVLAMDRDGLLVDAPSLGPVRVGLLGRHQAANAAVALAIVDALEAAGIASVPRAARRLGLEQARWPGRLEIVDAGGVSVVLDGAHNPAGAAALASALLELHPSLGGGPTTLVMAVMADKDVAGMLGELDAGELMRGARIIAPRVGGARGLEPEELTAAWLRRRPDVGTEVRSTLDDALDEGLSRARSAGGPLVVAGSLYLVGAMRGVLLRRGWLER
jgi:dihydrofolate synthase/folylpolyglutamate synthase